MVVCFVLETTTCILDQVLVINISFSYFRISVSGEQQILWL